MRYLEIGKLGGYKFPAIVQVVSDSSGEAITDAAVTVEVYNAATPAQKFDWADKSFKTSGWTTGSLALTHVTRGVYQAIGSIDQGGGVLASVFADGAILLVVPVVTPAGGVAIPGEAYHLTCAQLVQAALDGPNGSQLVKNGAVWELRVRNNQGAVAITHTLKGPDGTTNVADPAATAIGYRSKGA